MDGAELGWYTSTVRISGRTTHTICVPESRYCWTLTATEPNVSDPHGQVGGDSGLRIQIDGHMGARYDGKVGLARRGRPDDLECGLRSAHDQSIELR